MFNITFASKQFCFK